MRICTCNSLNCSNRNKVIAPFQYAESLFAVLAVVKSMTGLPYRYLQRMLIETLGDGDSPCYTTIYRRFQALISKETTACLPSQAT